MTNVTHFRFSLIASALAVLLGLCSKSAAQFTQGILANDSYWNDGKAEFDIYDAQLMRAGEPRHSEVLHILWRERVDPKTFTRLNDPKRSDGVFVVRMHQIWNAPVGLFVEQGSLTSLWRLDTLALVRLGFIGTDSFGNVARRIEQDNLFCDSDRDGRSTIPLNPAANAVFYDELPLRVRSIDFHKPPVDFEIALAPSISGFAKCDALSFVPAKVSWKPAQKSIEVTVQHAGGRDRFLVDGEFPFLLREWNAVDGSKLKMKRALKADYWNYSRNGDRERALKNPMLQHPD